MGKKVKKVWSYPSFAWFWDHDRDTLLDRLEGSPFASVMEKNNLKLSDVGDWERFDGFYFVIWRNGKTSKISREGVKE